MDTASALPCVQPAVGLLKQLPRAAASSLRSRGCLQQTAQAAAAGRQLHVRYAHKVGSAPNQHNRACGYSHYALITKPHKEKNTGE